jgi:hypothetical protein
MHGTLIGNIQEPGALLARQISAEVNFAFNLIERYIFTFAIRAIRGVNFGVTKMNDYIFQRPRFAVRVQRHGHRCARSERA